MSRQQVDFTTGSDSGENVNTSVQPYTNTEPASAAVLGRPIENLRKRTEVTRTELEALKYLSDSDRALLLTSAGSITWNGVSSGTFTIDPTQPLVLKPFTAPAASTAARLIIGAGTASQVTIRTRQDGLPGVPRAYNGANNITFAFPAVNTGTGAVTVAVNGAETMRFVVTHDSNITSGTTVNQLLTALNSNPDFINAGLEAVVEGTGSPVEVGFPPPPSPLVGNRLVLSGGELLERYLTGAADAEQHIISSAQLVNFFGATALNHLIEGDVLCVGYDGLVMDSSGGRRQSLPTTPENKSASAGNNLFLARRFPDRLPGALPLATVVNGQLIFISGRVYGSGESGPLTSSGSSYQGSTPNAFADGTTIAAGSFESAIDTLVGFLGAEASPSGAEKVGIQAIPGPGGGISIVAGSVYNAVSTVLTGLNGLISNLINSSGSGLIGRAATSGLSSTTVEGALTSLASTVGTLVTSVAGKAGLNIPNIFTQKNTFTAGAGTLGVDVVGGNNFDLTTSEGDVRIGNATNRLRIGVNTAGFSAGSTVIDTTGAGTANILILSAGGTAGISIDKTGKTASYGDLITGGDFKYPSAAACHAQAAMSETHADVNWAYNFNIAVDPLGYWKLTTTAQGVLVGRIPIPTGAVVTGLLVAYANTGASTVNATISCGEMRATYGGGTWTGSNSFVSLATLPLAVQAAGWGTTVTGTAMSPIGDDSVGLRWAIQVPAGVANTISIYGVRVAYTYIAVGRPA